MRQMAPARGSEPFLPLPTLARMALQHTVEITERVTYLCAPYRPKRFSGINVGPETQAIRGILTPCRRVRLVAASWQPRGDLVAALWKTTEQQRPWLVTRP